MRFKGEEGVFGLRGLVRLGGTCGLVLGLFGCSAPPLLVQNSTSLPLVEQKGDLILEGAPGINLAGENAPGKNLNDEYGFVYQGHLTWAFHDSMAVRIGGSRMEDVDVRDDTAGQSGGTDSTLPRNVEERAQYEADLALGWFFPSDEGIRIAEVYAGVANGKAGGGFVGAPCAVRCDRNSLGGEHTVYGSYHHSYLDLNMAWKLGQRQRWLLGFSGRLAHYDPYDLRDVNGVRMDATTRTMLEPSIFTGFRVGRFQLIGQYSDAVQTGGSTGDYEFAEDVVSLRLQWRIQ